jgi:hypothetical protein
MDAKNAAVVFESEFLHIISDDTAESFKNIIIEKVDNGTIMKLGKPIKPIVMYKATGIFKKDMLSDFLTKVKEQIPEDEYTVGYDSMAIMNLPKAPIVPAILFVYLTPTK